MDLAPETEAVGLDNIVVLLLPSVFYLFIIIFVARGYTMGIG